MEERKKSSQRVVPRQSCVSDCITSCAVAFNDCAIVRAEQLPGYNFHLGADFAMACPTSSYAGVVMQQDLEHRLLYLASSGF